MSEGTVFVDIVGDSAKFQQSLKEVESSSDVIVGALTSKFKQLAVIAATIFSVDAMKNYVKEATLLASRVETLGIVMNIVGSNAGYTSGEMAKFEAGVKKMGITTQESRQSLINLAQANVDLNKATQLARVAQDAAVIGNMNSSEAFSRMIYGIKAGQTEVLRTIGINVNFMQSYQKMAIELKRNVNALTEEEKSLARANAVIEYGTIIAGAYTAAMGTAGKQMQSMARYFEEIKLKIGEIGLEALTKGVMALVEGLNLTNKELSDTSAKEFMKGMSDVASVISNDVIAAAKELGVVFKEIISLIKNSPELLMLLVLAIRVVIEAMKDLLILTEGFLVLVNKAIDGWRLIYMSIRAAANAAGGDFKAAAAWLDEIEKKSAKMLAADEAREKRRSGQTAAVDTGYDRTKSKYFNKEDEEQLKADASVRTNIIKRLADEEDKYREQLRASAASSAISIQKATLAANVDNSRRAANEEISIQEDGNKRILADMKNRQEAEMDIISTTKEFAISGAKEERDNAIEQANQVLANAKKVAAAEVAESKLKDPGGVDAGVLMAAKTTTAILANEKAVADAKAAYRAKERAANTTEYMDKMALQEKERLKIIDNANKLAESLSTAADQSEKDTIAQNAALKAQADQYEGVMQAMDPALAAMLELKNAISVVGAAFLTGKIGADEFNKSVQFLKDSNALKLINQDLAKLEEVLGIFSPEYTAAMKTSIELQATLLNDFMTAKGLAFNKEQWIADQEMLLDLKKLEAKATYYSGIAGMEKEALQAATAAAKLRAQIEGKKAGASPEAIKQKGIQDVMSLQHKAFLKETQQISDGLGNMESAFTAISNMYAEGSKEHEKWAQAAADMMVAQKALALVNAVAAVAAAGTGPWPANIASVVAMAAAMASLLGSINVSMGGSGKVNVPTSGYGIASTSQVLGAKEGTASESVTKGFAILDDIYSLEYSELKGIHDSMKQLNTNITGLVRQIVYGAKAGFGPLTDETVVNALLPGLSATFNMIEGSLAGKVFNWIDNFLWGATSKFTSAMGYTVTDQGTVRPYSEVTTERSSGLLGFTNLFSSGSGTDIERATGEIDEALTKMFSGPNGIFTNLKSTVIDLATKLGGDITAATDWKFTDIDWNFLGKTPDEINQMISDTISEIGDNMITTVIPKLMALYQQVGEAPLEMAIRLAVDKATIEKILGKTNADFTPIKGNILSGNSDAGQWIAMSESLIKIAGGLDKLTEAAATYYDKFFTDAEKQADLQKDLTESFAAQGAVLPETRENYRMLVEGLDLTNPAMQALYVLLMQNAEAADAYYSVLEEGLPVVRTLKEIADQKADLEEKLLTLGMTQAQLDEKWILSLDAENQTTGRLIIAKQKSLDITDEATGLQDRLYAATDTTAEAAARARSKIDPLNLTLYDTVIAAEKANKILTEGATLQDRLYAATDTTAEAAARARSKIDPLNLALYDLVIAAEASAKATKDAADVADKLAADKLAAQSIQKGAQDIIDKHNMTPQQLATKETNQWYNDQITAWMKLENAMSTADYLDGITRIGVAWGIMIDDAADAAAAATLAINNDLQAKLLTAKADYLAASGDTAGAEVLRKQAIAYQREIELSQLENDTQREFQKSIWEFEDATEALLQFAADMANRMGLWENYFTNLQQYATPEQKAQLKDAGWNSLEDFRNTQMLTLKSQLAALNIGSSDWLAKMMEILTLQGTIAEAEKERLLARHNLDIELLDALGLSEEALAMKRLDELKAMDESLRATQLQIWAVQDLTASIDKFQARAEEISQFIDELTRGNLAPVQSAKAWDDKYNTMRTAAMGANATDKQISDYLSYAKEYLAFQQQYGTEGSYKAIYNAIMKDVTGLGDANANSLTVAEQQLDAIKSQVQATIDIGKQAALDMRELIGAVIGRGNGRPPTFAEGGSFAGGVRIVGERGPELETTGPSYITNASKTTELLRSGNVTNIEELRQLRASIDRLADQQGDNVFKIDLDGREIGNSVARQVPRNDNLRKSIKKAVG